MQTSDIVNNTISEIKNGFEKEEWRDIGNVGNKIENEIWKPIKNYENFYECSNLGHVRSLFHNKIKNLKPILIKSGYYNISLYRDRKPHIVRLHRIIAKTFIPNPNNLPYINHKNGIKTDNKIENLEWCTAKENSQHAIQHGLTTFNHLEGETNGQSKLTEEQILKMRKLYYTSKITLLKLGEIFQVNLITVQNAVTFITWKHLNQFYDLYLAQKEEKRVTRAKGERNGNSKLTEEQVRKIRELYSSRQYSSLQLSKIFKVAKSSVLSIIHKKTWRNI